MLKFLKLILCLLARAIFNLNYSDFKCLRKETISPELLDGLHSLIELKTLKDKKFMPKMLNGVTWEDVKKQIENSIFLYSEKRIRKIKSELLISRKIK